ncbi:MAG: NADH-quinone oxidoreductase subunit M [Elusimicrobiota bacterium]|nr:NADH-quinone oxidoreductase subunit M [Elusimicrobiota bacterium]
MTPLTLLWVLPAAGALACGAGGLAGRRVARGLALLFATAHLAATALVFSALLKTGGVGFYAESGPTWAYGISYSLAADGLSASLIVLTAFLTFICVVASWELEVGAGYWAAFLALSSALCGVFLARDLFFFYAFWEATLIPMFFIIGLWGSENRRKAAVKFFLFTFAGSVFMLLGILALVTAKHAAGGVWSWDLAVLDSAKSSFPAWAFWGLVAGFAVKIPLAPLHTWLPDAHTEAPAAGSVMLAGVMLKMGVYGLLRVAIPLFPELSWEALPLIGGLAAFSTVYGALCAMAQGDLKRLIAYSSVAHLGFCVLGAFSRSPQGLAGASLQMLNHGITTGALFLLVGFLYERTHKRGLADFGGLAARAPWLTFFFGFSTLASIGLPGLNGFVGEFLALFGAATALPALAIGGAVGVTLAPAYALPAFQAVFWGPEGPGSKSAEVTDLTLREKSILWTLCALMLWIGLRPTPWLAALEPSLRGLAR